MSQFKVLLLAGGMIAAVGTNAVQAAPALSYELLINNVVVVSQTSPGAMSSTGSIGANPGAGQLPVGFSQLTFSSTGVTTSANPTLATFGTIATNGSFTGSAQNPTVVELLVFQTGLTMPVGTPTFTSTLSLSNGGGVTSASVTAVDPSNSAATMATPTTVDVAMLTNNGAGTLTNGVGGQSGAVPVGATPTFSETEAFLGTFTAGGQTLNFQGQVGVPEPASLALLGTALFGLSFIRRRRNRS